MRSFLWLNSHFFQAILKIIAYHVIFVIIKKEVPMLPMLMLSLVIIKFCTCSIQCSQCCLMSWRKRACSPCFPGFSHGFWDGEKMLIGGGEGGGGLVKLQWISPQLNVLASNTFNFQLFVSINQIIPCKKFFSAPWHNMQWDHFFG